MVGENTSLETNRLPEWLDSRLGECEQRHLIEKYWKKLERKFQISPDWIDEYIIDFVTFKQNKDRRDSYNSSRNFIDLLRDETEETLESMLRYADFYIEYVLANDPDYNFEKREIRNLRLLGYGPAILIMRLRDLLASERLDKETYRKMLSSLESYRVRLAVMGKLNHWKVFYKLTSLICENDPLESFLSAMKNMEVNDTEYKFPNDNDFRDQFKKIDFYDSDDMSNEWCKLILYRLENYNRDIQSIPSEHYYQIEHIMPQTIEDTKWKCILGENHKEYWKWCNKIGNLTLVPSINLNLMLSNELYEDKKKIANCYIEIETQFRLNKCVWEKEKWTFDEIEERGEKLADKAIEIWPDLNNIFDKILSD